MHNGKRGNTDKKEAFTMKNEQDRHRIEITVRDRLLRAWENSMEMARDLRATRTNTMQTRNTAAHSQNMQ